MRLYGNIFQRLKAKGYYKRYSKKIAEEIKNVLKPKGLLLLWSTIHDFRINPIKLINTGLNYNTIEIPSEIVYGMFRLDIYQK